jgi:HlyD family secretion protein
MRSNRRRQRQPEAYGRKLKMAGALVLSFSIISGCSAQDIFPGNPASGQEQAIKNVKAMKVTKQKIGEAPELTADILPSVQIEVLVKTKGDVVELVKKRGDVVREGDVIARVDSIDVKLEKERAIIALGSAKDALDKARKDMESNKTELKNSIQKLEQNEVEMTRSFNKLRNDYDKGLATKAQLSKAQNDLTNLKLDLDLLRQKQRVQVTTDSLSGLEAQVRSAEIIVQLAEQTLANQEIKAPVDGVLTDLPLEVGMTVAQGMRVGLVQKMDLLKIRAFLNDEALRLANGKSHLGFYIPGTDRSYAGRVSYVSTVLDPTTRAYEMNLEADNPELALKPGMKVRLRLSDEMDQNVVAVPVGSVIQELGEAYVFVLKDNVVEKRKVEIGRLNESEMIQEILSGLQEGELLVVSGQNRVKDKEKVQSAMVDA